MPQRHLTEIGMGRSHADRHPPSPSRTAGPSASPRD